MKWTYAAIAILVGGLFAVYYFIVRPKQQAQTIAEPNIEVSKPITSHYIVGEIPGDPVVPYMGDPVVPYVNNEQIALAGGQQSILSPASIQKVPITSREFTVDVDNEPVTVAVINGGLIPIPEATNSLTMKNTIMEAQLAAVAQDAEAARVAQAMTLPVGRQVSLADLKNKTYKIGDTFTVTAAQYRSAEGGEQYLWYNSPIDAPMIYTQNGWILNTAYNQQKSTPALEYVARSFIAMQSPTYEAERKAAYDASVIAANASAGW
jgi:hypothetical protein